MRKLKLFLGFAFLLTAVLGFGACGLFGGGGNGGGNGKTYSIEITSAEGGEVVLSADKKSYEISSGETKTYSFEEDTLLEFKATANADYKFSYWEVFGGENSYNPLSFNLTENDTIKAVFEYLYKTVTVVDENQTTLKTFSFYGNGLYNKLQTEVVASGYSYTFSVNGTPLTPQSRFSVDEDITVVATKSLIDYSISYNLAGGSVESENATAYNAESQTITLNNPTKYGYTFAGWTGTDLDAATKTVTIQTGSTGERAYTATWDPIVYGISYDLDGGSFETPSPTTYTIESQITLETPKKEHYEFAGWLGTGISEPIAGVTLEKGSSGAKSYTATWRLKEYYIQYVLNGGTVEIENPSFYTIESEAITLNNPTKAGYTFAGWTGTDLDAATQTVTIETGSSGYRYYNATWDINEYTLNYKSGGSTVKTEIYTVEKEKPQVVQEDGYYIEWQVGSTPWSDYDIVESGDLVVDIEVSKKVAYKVTIKDWDNPNFGKDLKKYHYDQAARTITFVYVDGDEPIILKAANSTPVRENYDFLYWSDGNNAFSKESLGEVVIDTTIQTDQTFTAIWFKSIKVTYDNYDGTNMPTRILIATDGKVYKQNYLTMENVAYYGTFNEYENDLQGEVSSMYVTDSSGNVVYRVVSVAHNSAVSSWFSSVVKNVDVDKQLNMTLSFSF